MTDRLVRMLVIGYEPGSYEYWVRHLQEVLTYELDSITISGNAPSLPIGIIKQYDLVILNESPSMASHTEAVLALIQNENPETRIIVVGERGTEASIKLLRVGVYRYFRVPLNLEELILAVKFAIEASWMHSSQRLQSLYEASNHILQAQDADDALKRSVSAAWRATGAWGAELRLLDSGGKLLHLIFSGYDDEPNWPRTIREAGITKEVFRSGIPKFIDNVTTASERINPGLLEHGVRAAACIPLRSIKRKVGVLWIHFNQEHQFSEKEKHVLQVCANLCAAMYDQLQRLQELERLKDALQGLTTLSGSSLRAIVKQIVRHAGLVLEYEVSMLWYYDDESAAFVSPETYVRETGTEVTELLRQNNGLLSLVHSILENQDPVVYGISNVEDYNLRQALEADGIETIRGITLRAGPEKLGVLLLISKLPDREQVQSDALLRTFVAHAALSLRIAKLLDLLHRTRDVAAVIAQVTTSSQDAESTWQRMVLDVKAALECDAVVLYQYDSNTTELLFPPIMTGVTYPERVTRPESVEERSIVWSVIESSKQGEWLKVEDAVSDQRTKEIRFTREEGVRSLLGIPLMAHGRVIGALFANYRSQRTFKKEELNQFKHFIQSIASALDTMQRYEEHRDPASSLTVHELLNHIAEQARYIVQIAHQKGSVFSHIALLEGRKLHFVAASPHGILSALQKNIAEIDLDKDSEIGIVGLAAKTGKLQNVLDTEHDSQYLALKGRKRAGSQLSVPIKTLGGRVIGVISVEHESTGVFQLEDVRHIRLLAAQAAAAVESARRLSANTKLAWAGMASSIWLHSLQGSINDVTSRIQTLVEGIPELVTQAESQKVLVDELSSMQIKLRDSLREPTAYLLSSNEGIRVFSVNEVIRRRVDTLLRAYPYNPVQCQFDLPEDRQVLIRANPEWISQVFDILIKNAFEAMRRSPAPKLTIRARPSNGDIEIEIADNGAGISLQVLAKLFYQSISRKLGSKGMGIGLLMAQSITQRYGGELQVTSTGTTGTIVTVRLPASKSTLEI